MAIHVHRHRGAMRLAGTAGRMCLRARVLHDTGFGVASCIDSTGAEQEDAAIFAEDLLQWSVYQESDDGGTAIARHTPGAASPASPG